MDLSLHKKCRRTKGGTVRGEKKHEPESTERMHFIQRLILALFYRARNEVLNCRPICANEHDMCRHHCHREHRE